jgi:hypothetical protein
MDSNMAAALAVLGITQTGALIYFAGSVASTLRAHEKRLDDHNVLLNLLIEGKREQ